VTGVPGGIADEPARPSVGEDASGRRGSSEQPGRRVSSYFRLSRRELPAGSGELVRLVGRAPIDPHHRSPAGGLVTSGIVTHVDSIGGMACGLAVLPRWIVTSTLLVRVLRPGHEGPLEVDGRVVRAGRRSATADLRVRDEGGGGALVATAEVTCAVLDPGILDLDLSRPVVFDAPAADPDGVAPEAFFCLSPGDDGSVVLEVADYLRNPWGILHGGAVAALADAAATRAAVWSGAVTPVVTRDTEVHYLRPVRVGPVVARAKVLGERADGWVVEVTLSDTGAEDRVVATAVLTVGSVAGRPS
jgi:uncharacterized protein (TIGR00369 family)